MDKSRIPKNRRLDLSPARAVSNAEFAEALACVRRSGVADLIEDRLDRRSDARAALSVIGLEVAIALRGFEKSHTMTTVEICRIINAFDSSQLECLAMTQWRQKGCYDRVEALFGHISRALEEGWEVVNGSTGEVTRFDLQAYIDAVVRSTVPDQFMRNAALAVDGTDMPTWGALRSDYGVDCDGEASLDEEEGLDENAEEGAEGRVTTGGDEQKSRRRTAAVLGIGEDERKIYTKDRDARAGHRSATNEHPAGPYVGRELHIGVTVKRSTWTDSISATRFGEDVPALIVTTNLTPAGFHRGKAVIGSLVKAADEGILKEVLADPGYTLAKGYNFHFPLQQAGVALVGKSAAWQRNLKGKVGDAIRLDGQLFSDLIPEELRNLPMPPLGSDMETKKPFIEQFEKRAAYAFSRHATPGANGVSRWRCPFCVGRLRSRQLPKTMRNGRKGKLVKLPTGTSACCSGVFSVGADQLPMQQAAIFGTAAWWQSWGRRSIVESVNSALKGAFTTIERGYVRTMETTRISILLAHTLAGYNRWALRSWKQMQKYLKEKTAKAKRASREKRLKRFEDLPLAVTASSINASPDPKPKPPPD